jgi:hypothetical protein
MPLSLPSTSLPMLALAAVLTGVLPADAAAQRVGGSIGVSLTILEPVTTRGVEVTGFRVDKDGRATLETTAPTTGQTSQLVMARVSSSANGFQPVEQAPVLVAGERRDAPARAASRMSYRVDVGGAGAAGAGRDVQLRIEYLAVAGT